LKPQQSNQGVFAAKSNDTDGFSISPLGIAKQAVMAASPYIDKTGENIDLRNVTMSTQRLYSGKDGFDPYIQQENFNQAMLLSHGTMMPPLVSHATMENWHKNMLLSVKESMKTGAGKIEISCGVDYDVAEQLSPSGQGAGFSGGCSVNLNR